MRCHAAPVCVSAHSCTLCLIVLQEYLSVFSPLLLEEAVEGVRSSFEEAERKGKGAAVTLTE
jgi:hypothetical protein